LDSLSFIPVSENADLNELFTLDPKLVILLFKLVNFDDIPSETYFSFSIVFAAKSPLLTN
jgi:hypothetical protein